MATWRKCCNFITKQIIGQYPGYGSQECLYVMTINSQDYFVSDFVGWTLNGNDFITELSLFGSVNQYTNELGNKSVFIYYSGTQPTDLIVNVPGFGDTLFTIRKATNFEGASCDLVCYQASFDYGYQWRFIDFFASSAATPYYSPSAYDISDDTNLQYFASSFLGSQISVSSVWDGSQYVVTINNAFNLGGFQLGDGGAVYTNFTALPCEIVPPTPQDVFLLDVYTNATAGYSVRKIKSSATVSIRVRRSSDNAEQDIGFLGVNLDVASLTSFVGANNGFITRWYDQTGQSRDFAQLTASVQPRIVNAGVIDMANGIPSIFFGEATIKYMETFNSAEPYFDFTDTFSLYMTLKPANQSGSQVSFGKGTGLFGQNAYYAVFDPTTNVGVCVLNNNTTSPTNSSLIANGNANLGVYGWNLSAGNGIASFNGTINNSYSGLISAKLNGSNPIIGVYQTFASATDFDGWFSELIVYPTDQSANRLSIENNTKNYFGI